MIRLQLDGYVALFSAEGKDGFYRRLGFEVHPRGMKLSE